MTDEGVAKVMLQMAENNLIDSVSPAKLKAYVLALEALNLDGLNEDQRLAKILGFIGSNLITRGLDPMNIGEGCMIWKLHFEGKLPVYAYEE